MLNYIRDFICCVKSSILLKVEMRIGRESSLSSVEVYVVRILILCFVVLFSGCASGYKQFYQPENGVTLEKIAARRLAPPPVVPIVERVSPNIGQNELDAYMKRGYAIIGTSFFISADTESEESAIKQGQDVGADLVLIFDSKYVDSVSSVVPITRPTITTSYSSGSATAYGNSGSVISYGRGTTTTYGTTTNYQSLTIHRHEYGAIYFVKLKYLLGANFRNLEDFERRKIQTNKGVVIEMIVDGSPAFNADLLPGDIVTAIDSIRISDAEEFEDLLNFRRGKNINLSLLRNEKSVELSVQLNP